MVTDEIRGLKLKVFFCLLVFVCLFLKRESSCMIEFLLKISLGKFSSYYIFPHVKFGILPVICEM